MADDPGARVVDVLLVEDDPGDVLMTREAFDHHKIRNLSLIHISEPTRRS